jgi:geranylgeranyl diphosphate synthase, type II
MVAVPKSPKRVGSTGWPREGLSLVWELTVNNITMESKVFQSTIALDVPAEKSKRFGIKAAVELYFLENKMIPPVSYDALYEVASLLIENKNWEEQYRAFIMVCCGNAIWRPVVGSIPYNRRIFLLPQCLRNVNLCKAQQDELGLLCSECGNCSISGFLREAENLGYVALVTEGTTITTRLIESGKVDAVIGVGCMEVLQKMFASVSKYSIPSIGIPLITCGCVDTSADADWIKQEIYNYREDPTIRLLNLNYLRNKTSSIFGEEQLVRILGTAKNKTEIIAFESLLSGGQRLRPFLAVLAYESFVNEPDPAVLNMLALSVECFHKASLIHDDIEDNDDMRYGKEAIHARYGIPVAINTGDYLIGEGYRLISESTLSAEKIKEAVKIISRGHRSLSIGQGAELISIRSKKILPLDEMLELFGNKTSAAFKVSLSLGAALGGASHKTIEILDRFSNSIGIGYQIKDDLTDYQGNKGDIAVRKFSILLSVLKEQIPQSKRETLLNAYKFDDYEAIYELIDHYQIQDATKELLISTIDDAKSSLESISNLGLKLALHEILGKIFKEYI